MPPAVGIPSAGALPPVVPAGAAWAVGIAMAKGPGLAAAWSVAAVVAAAAVLAVPRRAHSSRLLLLAALGLAAGAARQGWAMRPPEPGNIAGYLDRRLVLRGWVGDEAWLKDGRASYRVDAVAVAEPGGGPSTQGGPGNGPEWRPVRGRILVQTGAYPPLKYGDGVIVTGTLEAAPVFEGFDYRAYLAQRGVAAVMWRPAVARAGAPGGHWWRRWLLEAKGRGRWALAQALPEPEASLAVGILLGDDRGIPEVVDEAFRRTNTTHVIAISGSNIALVVAALMATLGRCLGRRRAAPVTLAALVAYTALVGADAAVVRAALMGAVALIGLVVRRPGHAAAALVTSGWIMTAYRPAYLWDLGFQLSFAATVGLVVYSARFSAGLEAALVGRVPARRLGGIMALANEAVLLTLAAQLTTWPLVAFHTGQASVAGLLANALILPAQPPIMGLAAVTAAAGTLSAAAGRLAGVLAWLPLAYTIRVVEMASGWPGAGLAVSLSAPAVAAYYIVLTALSWPGGLRAAGHAVATRRRRDGSPEGAARGKGAPGRGGAASPSRHRRWPPSWLVLGGGAVVTVLVWVAALMAPDGWLHVVFLDVGQGDAILVITPSGHRLLVDAGPGSRAVLDGLGRRTPPWDRRLDAVVATHGDSDHIGGMAEVLRRYDVGWVLDSGMSGGAPAAKDYSAAAASGTRGRAVVSAGAELVLDDKAGVFAEVLWPPADLEPSPENTANRHAVVTAVRYRRFTALLTADADAEVEAALVASGVDLRADVLKVGHHGSRTSTTDEFLAAVAPAAAVISVGADNSFGHPTPATLRRLAGIPVWRTDRDGPVEVLSDGEAAWVTWDRGPGPPPGVPEPKVRRQAVHQPPRWRGE